MALKDKLLVRRSADQRTRLEQMIGAGRYAAATGEQRRHHVALFIYLLTLRSKHTQRIA